MLLSRRMETDIETGTKRMHLIGLAVLGVPKVVGLGKKRDRAIRTPSKAVVFLTWGTCTTAVPTT